MGDDNPSYQDPEVKSADPEFNGGPISTVQMEPPESTAPPAYSSTGGGESPPAYDSIYGKLVAAKDNSDGNMDFAKKSYGICCASLCPLICTLSIWGIALASLIMGAVHINDCPIEKMIPVYLIVYGTVFTVKSCTTTSKYVANRDKEDQEEESKAWSLERLLDCFLFIWFIVGNVYVYRNHKTYQSVDPTLANYCHGDLYKFAFWTITLNYIMIGLLFVFGCCMCFFMCCCACCKKSDSN